jgi:hypothetical protein
MPSLTVFARLEVVIATENIGWSRHHIWLENHFTERTIAPGLPLS